MTLFAVLPEGSYGRRLFSKIQNMSRHPAIMISPDVEITFRNDQKCQEFTLGGTKVSDTDRLAWLPAFSTGSLGSSTVRDSGLADKAFAQSQWDEAAFIIETFWPGHILPAAPAHVIHWSRRSAALRLAANQGFSVPSYTVTSDRDQAAAFVELAELQGDQVVMKRLADNKLLLDGRVSVPFLVTSERLKREASLGCPVWLERRINGPLEYRVFVFPNQCLAVQAEACMDGVDARYTPHPPVWRISEVPSEHKLRSLCRQMGLSYCCFDVIDDINGISYIIDVNPLGTSDGLPDIVQEQHITLVSEMLLDYT